METSSRLRIRVGYPAVEPASVDDVGFILLIVRFNHFHLSPVLLLLHVQASLPSGLFKAKRLFGLECQLMDLVAYANELYHAHVEKAK